MAVDKYKYKYEKKSGQGTNTVKKILACNAVVMLKIETRPGCTRTNSSGSAQEMNKKKKNHF